MNRAVRGKTRILVVDDSAFMRLAISSTLASDPDIEVVGTAVDGIEAVEKACHLKPEVITMDIEMPRMDGITALKEIMAKCPTHVLMVSTQTREGAMVTMEALESGAVDFIPKSPDGTSWQAKFFRAELLRKVKGLSNQIGMIRSTSLLGEALANTETLESGRITAIAIGASTGGPMALQKVLANIPSSFSHPIVAGIHMPKLFTGHYAAHLNAKCPLEILEAENGNQLRPGRVLICPGGMHTSFSRQQGEIVAATSPAESNPQFIYIPSIDLMMRTLSDACSGAMLGVILTGMGSDGFKGMQHLKQMGGITLVQDEATSTIYGMPRACVEGGVADSVLPLEIIGREIIKLAA